MKSLWNMVRWDVILLHRQNIFVLAIAVALLYIGVFYLLSEFGNLGNLLVIVIYNDPVITGFLFAAIIVMMDKQNRMVKAISVLPIKSEYYLLSKAILLSLVACLISLIIAIIGKGTDIAFVHVIASTFLGSLLFCMIGFYIGLQAKSFNLLLLYSVPIVTLLSIPFLVFVNIGSWLSYILIPTTGIIVLLREAIFNEHSFFSFGAWYIVLIFWSVLFYRLATNKLKQIVK